MRTNSVHERSTATAGMVKSPAAARMKSPVTWKAAEITDDAVSQRSLPTAASTGNPSIITGNEKSRTGATRRTTSVPAT